MKVDKLSKNQVFNNSLWKFFESVGSSGIQLLVTLILARLLTPHDYGLMAIVLVVVTFLALFINSGIASYLVYLKDVKKQDFLTTLIINVGVSVLLLFGLLLSSGTIADYYSAPSLKPLIMAMAISLPFNAISSVYNAYAIKLSYFRALFVRNMIALPTSGILALILAYTGYGVWALVAQQLSSSVLLALIMVVTIKVNVDGVWQVNMGIVKPMLKFGGFTLLTTIIAFISDNISDLLIGKRISPKQLGYYNRGCHFPGSFVNIFNNVLAGVFFPAFASYNSDIADLKEKSRKTIRLLYFVVFPLFFGLIACTKPLILVILTEKWAGTILVMQIICLYYCMIPFLQTYSQVFLATGHVKLRTVGEIVKMVLTLPLLFLIVDFGIIAVALARVAVNATLVVYSMIINKYVLNYTFSEFLSDMIRPLLLGLLVFAMLYPVNFIPIDMRLILIIQFVIGGVIYLLCVKIMRIKEIMELISLVIAKVKR